MFRITSKFGQQESFRPKGHSGIDISYPDHTPLKAVEDGTVHLANYGDTNSGMTVILNTEDGHRIVYGHLSKFNVSEGAKVNAGDIIAESGHSGHVVSSHGNGAHLHLGLKDSQGHLQNPEKYVNTDGTLSISSTNQQQVEMPSPGNCNIYEHKDPSELFNTAMEKFNDSLSEMATNFIDLFLQYSISTLNFVCENVLPFLF